MWCECGNQILRMKSPGMQPPKNVAFAKSKSSGAPGTESLAPGTKIQQEGGEWPEPEVLEAWLQEVAAETDTSAKALREMLRGHPGYGKFLATDSTLADICRLMVRRVRAVVVQTLDDGVRALPHLLLQAVAACVWRAVGATVEALEKSPKDSVPNQKASGQIQMLMKANKDLHAKLNDSRNKYLQELMVLRTQVHSNPDVDAALAHVNSQHAVMFYEPLDSIVDEPTKDFVKACVTERLRLLLQRGWRRLENGEEDEISQYLRDLEERQKRLEHDAKRKTHKDIMDVLRKHDELLQGRTTRTMPDEEENSEGEGGENWEDGTDSLRASLRELRESLEEDEEDEEEDETMSPMDRRLSQEKKRQSLEQKLKVAESSLAKLQKERAGHKWKLNALKIKVKMLAPSVQEALQTQAKLDSLKVAYSQLEMELAQERSQQSKGGIEEMLIKTELKEHRRHLMDQSAELAALKLFFEEHRDCGGATDANRKVAELRGECTEWRSKYEDLLDKHSRFVKHMRQHAEHGREIDAETAMDELGLEEPPPPKKHHPKNAFARLYEDALARQQRMADKAMKLWKEEGAALAVVKKTIRSGDHQQHERLAMLQRMQSACNAQSRQFHKEFEAFVQEETLQSILAPETEEQPLSSRVAFLEEALGHEEQTALVVHGSGRPASSPDSPKLRRGQGVFPSANLRGKNNKGKLVGGRENSPQLGLADRTVLDPTREILKGHAMLEKRDQTQLASKVGRKVLIGNSAEGFVQHSSVPMWSSAALAAGAEPLLHSASMPALPKPVTPSLLSTLKQPSALHGVKPFKQIASEAKLQTLSKEALLLSSIPSQPPSRRMELAMAEGMGRSLMPPVRKLVEGSPTSQGSFRQEAPPVKVPTVSASVTKKVDG